jgi:ectoine hydroxylase-related dioxygenase (phytanoyl-CoA dioxygenase family)
MKSGDRDSISHRYDRDGYYFPIDVMSEQEARSYRQQLEDFETDPGENFQNKEIWFTNANFVLPFVDEISRLPAVLEPIISILGPDLLVWNASFFTKEPDTPDFVSWHQDLKYWGLSDVEEVTAWIALSPANVESGCMQFVPGTHTRDLLDHRDTFLDVNMLSRGQELAVEVNDDEAVDVILAPGQMSLHHGRIFHASGANRSGDRRIGLAIRYITPKMKQVTGDKTYAHLVAGEDKIGNFNLLSPPAGIMLEKDIEIARQNIKIGEKFFYENAQQSGKKLR